MPAPLRVLSTLALQGALPEIIARHGAAGGVPVHAEYAPTNAILDRIQAGEVADIAIVTQAAVRDLVRDGVLLDGTQADICTSLVGLAVKAGAPKPDISTVPAFVATLRAARSVAYSRIGASGVFFAALIAKLGIAEEVNAKATVVPTGFTAALLPDGRAELAVQQISELLAVPGIEVVGPLPLGVQFPTVFSAGVFQICSNQKAAAQFVCYLAHLNVSPLLQGSGLEVIPCIVRR